MWVFGEADRADGSRRSACLSQPNTPLVQLLHLQIFIVLGLSGVFFSHPNIYDSIDPEDCSAEKRGIQSLV